MLPASRRQGDEGGHHVFVPGTVLPARFRLG
jgi:hypothetical protein